jgi:predicted RNase H-like HicB family nuclease
LLDGTEGAYGIALHDLPCCTAMDATMVEAYENAVATLTEWIADAASALPPPRSIEALRRNQDITEAPAEGTFTLLPVETERPGKANLASN